MCKKILQDNMRYIIISAILSAVLLVAGYFVNNLPIFTGENLDQFYITQKVCEKLGISHVFDDSDAFFVNVSYDKELVKAIDVQSHDVLGNMVITNRSKLFDFLKILKDKGEYKYIVLDIMFDPNDVSESDSLLYSLIASMDNIVIVRDDSIPVPNSKLLSKSALADYFSTITATNFVRYQYSNTDGIPYIPLKVYEDLNDNVKIKRHGPKWLPIYTSGGNLCYNSCFIPFDSKQFSAYSVVSKSYAVKKFYNLGSDILEDPTCTTDEDIEKNVIIPSIGKYVFVGNYTEDLHDTYMGPRPGPYIIYRALKILEGGNHLISFFKILYWFLIFTVIFWWIIADKKKISLTPQFLKKSRIWNNLVNYKLLGFVMSSLGYTVILFICSTMEYIFTCAIYSIVLPLYVFMFTKLFYDYKKFRIS